MNEIPAIYWMIIVGFIAFFFCLILLYLALLLKEARDAVKESREILKNSKETIERISKIVKEVEGVVGIARGTVEEVSNSIIKPVRAISGFIGSLGLLTKKNGEENPSNDIPTIEDLLDE